MQTVLAPFENPVNIDSFDNGNLKLPNLHSSSITWRQPKRKSLSDLTIIVKHGDSRTNYHLHKNEITSGRRRSEYLRNIFRTDGLLHNDDDNSDGNKQPYEINLEYTASKAFPLMLDYIYSYDGTLSVTTELAVALRYLANHFGVRELFTEVNRFIQAHMSAHALPIYFSEAVIYNDHLLCAALVPLIAENFEHMNMHFLLGITPDYYAKIMSCENMTCRSLLLSERTAEYLGTHYDKLNGDLVGVITCPRTMPRISPGTASFYAKLNSDYPQGAGGGGGGGGDEKNTLLSRCAEALMYRKNIKKKSLSLFPPSSSNGITMTPPATAYPSLAAVYVSDDERSIEAAETKSPSPAEFGIVSNDMRLKLAKSNLYHANKMIRKYEAEIKKLNSTCQKLKIKNQSLANKNGATSATQKKIAKSFMGQLSEMKQQQQQQQQQQQRRRNNSSLLGYDDNRDDNITAETVFPKNVVSPKSQSLLINNNRSSSSGLNFSKQRQIEKSFMSQLKEKQRRRHSPRGMYENRDDDDDDDDDEAVPLKVVMSPTTTTMSQSLMTTTTTPRNNNNNKLSRSKQEQIDKSFMSRLNNEKHQQQQRRRNTYSPRSGGVLYDNRDDTDDDHHAVPKVVVSPRSQSLISPRSQSLVSNNRSSNNNGLGRSKQRQMEKTRVVSPRSQQSLVHNNRSAAGLGLSQQRRMEKSFMGRLNSEKQQQQKQQQQQQQRRNNNSYCGVVYENRDDAAAAAAADAVPKISQVVY